MPTRGHAHPPSGQLNLRGRLILFFASATLLVVSWPALSGDAILGFRDMLHNYGPMRELFWSGRISLWNGLEFGGSPVLGDIVQQPFYLGNLVMRALHAPAWPGIAISLAVHVFLGMIATWLLLRRFVPGDAAALGGVVFGLCGFTFADFSNLQWACAATWVPAALLSFDLWAERGGPARTAFLAVALPQILLSGDPLLFVLTACAGLALLWRRRRRPVRELWPEGALALAGVLAIIAPQVVSSLRALPALARGAGLPREVREQWSLHPARIAELFVPRMFGPLFSAGFWGGFTVSPPWQRNYVHSIYAGVAGPALLWLAFQQRRREAATWAILGAVTLSLALGAYFFHLYGVLGEVVPLFHLFRYPQRLVALFMPAWAALMALGAAGLAQVPRGRRVALMAASAVLAGLVLGFTALCVQPDAAALRTSFLHLALAGAASCAALLLPSRYAATALALVLIVDLAAANAELLGLVPRSGLRAPPAACDALDEAAGRGDRATYRVFVDQQRLDTPNPDWAARRMHEYQFGKRNLLEACGFHEAVALTSLDPRDELTIFRELGARRMFHVLGTRFVVTAPGNAREFGGREVSVDGRWGFAIVELPAAPMLFRPQRVEQLPSSQVVAAARARPELLGAEVAALDAAPLQHLPDATATLVSWNDQGDRVFFRVRQAQPGYWVLSATLDGDWLADVDGRRSQIVREGLVRRAIWVPAGDHSVSLRYQPRLQLWLFALSALTTLGLACVAAYGALDRRGRVAPRPA